MKFDAGTTLFKDYDQGKFALALELYLGLEREDVADALEREWLDPLTITANEAWAACERYARWLGMLNES